MNLSGVYYGNSANIINTVQPISQLRSPFNNNSGPSRQHVSSSSSSSTINNVGRRPNGGNSSNSSLDEMGNNKANSRSGHGSKRPHQKVVSMLGSFDFD